MTIAVGALLAEACVGEYPLGPAPTLDALGPDGLLVRLDDHPRLADIGGVVSVPVAGGIPVGIARLSASTFQAFWLSCPHAGVVVTPYGEGFRCPNHLATFARDGSWVGGHPTPALETVPLTFDASAGTLLLGKAPPGAPPSRAPLVFVVEPAKVAALATVGGIALFGYGNGYPLALVRTGPAAYLALSPICQHRNYYVDIDDAGTGFLCPGHGAQFRADGTWYGGTSTSRLTPLSSTFDAVTGTVTVTIP
jgi:Rieske Fe-S protein